MKADIEVRRGERVQTLLISSQCRSDILIVIKVSKSEEAELALRRNKTATESFGERAPANGNPLEMRNLVSDWKT
jgi:hypothetical protein